MNSELLHRIVRPGFVGAVVCIFGCGLLFRGLILAGLESNLWGNDFDPHLIVWIVEWGYHKLFVSPDWLNFWNANQFFPHKGSLAFSDSMLSAQMFYGPLRMLGASPLLALYGALAGFSLLGCVLSDHALVRIGGFSTFERAIVIYIAHFSMPVTSFLGPHYQLFGFQLAPAFFLYLFLLGRDQKGGYLLTASTIFVLATGFSTYFAPMSTVVAIALAAIFALPHLCRSREIFQLAAARIGVAAFVISALLLAGLFFVQLLPYLKLMGKLPSQDWAETYQYSARFFSFLTDAPSDSLVYKAGQQTNGAWERSYFPGVLIWIFSVGGFLSVIRLSSEVACPLHKMRAIAMFALALLVIAYLLSLGPYQALQVGDGESFRVYMPFAVVAKLLPGINNIRAPGRFGMFMALALGLLCALGVKSLLKHLRNESFSPLKRKLLLAGLSGALMADSALHSQVFPYRVVHEQFYQAAKGHIEIGVPVAILPLARSGHLETIKNYMEQLKGSTIHFGWILAGYGARTTPELDRANYLDRLFQEHPSDETLAALVRHFRDISIAKVIVFPDDYTLAAQEKLRSLPDFGFTLVYSSGEGQVWSLHAKKEK